MALVERIGTIADLACTTPLTGGLGDVAYAAAFPDGLKPIATFRTDDPADLERAKAVLSREALTRFFSPGGGGMSAFTDALATSRSQHEGAGR